MLEHTIESIFFLRHLNGHRLEIPNSTCPKSSGKITPGGSPCRGNPQHRLERKRRKGRVRCGRGYISRPRQCGAMLPIGPSVKVVRNQCWPSHCLATVNQSIASLGSSNINTPCQPQKTTCCRNPLKLGISASRRTSTSLLYFSIVES